MDSQQMASQQMDSQQTVAEIENLIDKVKIKLILSDLMTTYFAE
jgi:hypothetical protein